MLFKYSLKKTIKLPYSRGTVACDVIDLALKFASSKGYDFTFCLNV